MKRTLLAAMAALAVSGGAVLAAQPGAMNDPSPMATASGQTPTLQAVPGQPGYVTEYSAFPQGAPLGERTVRGQDGTIGEFAPSDAPN